MLQHTPENVISANLAERGDCLHFGSRYTVPACVQIMRNVFFQLHLIINLFIVFLAANLSGIAKLTVLPKI